MDFNTTSLTEEKHGSVSTDPIFDKLLSIKGVDAHASDI
jgi:hypothetical protein